MIDDEVEENKELSEGAEKLIELVGTEGDLGATIKEHPELIDSLNEYAEWRDKNNRHAEVCKKSASVRHSLVRKR